MQTGYPRGTLIVFRMFYNMVFFYGFPLVLYVRSTKSFFHVFINILQTIYPPLIAYNLNINQRMCEKLKCVG